METQHLPYRFATIGARRWSAEEPLLKFSIRQMLIGMVAMAFYAAVIGAGANGSPVGYGLAIGIAALLVILPVLAILYWLAFATVARAQKRLDHPGRSRAQTVIGSADPALADPTLNEMPKTVSDAASIATSSTHERMP